MNGIWDSKSDVIEKGDNLRDVSQIIEKTRKDGKALFTMFLAKLNFLIHGIQFQKPISSCSKTL